jgi:hypothetical protein
LAWLSRALAFFCLNFSFLLTAGASWAWASTLFSYLDTWTNSSAIYLIVIGWYFNCPSSNLLIISFGAKRQFKIWEIMAPSNSEDSLSLMYWFNICLTHLITTSLSSIYLK